MNWINIGVLFLISNYVQGSEYRLEKFPGIRHDERVSESQAGCMSKCSKDTGCCAFSFILGEDNVCHFYRNCAQLPGTYNVNELRVFYKKDGVATQEATTESSTTRTTTLTTATVTYHPKQNETADDALFSTPQCKNADKKVFNHQYWDFPFLALTDPWQWCQACMEHAQYYSYTDALRFEPTYTSYGWRFAVVANSHFENNILRCDLIVECNLDHEFKNNILIVNNIPITTDPHIRITWQDATAQWTSKWGKNNLGETPVTSIECK